METGGPDVGAPAQDEKTQAMLSWILGIFIGIISPLIFMLVGKEKPFIYRNAMQGMAFQIVMLILWVIVGILSVVTCGIGVILYLVPWIWNLIVCIMGAIASNNGQVYEPMFTGKLAKSWFKV